MARDIETIGDLIRLRGHMLLECRRCGREARADLSRASPHMLVDDYIAKAYCSHCRKRGPDFKLRYDDLPGRMPISVRAIQLDNMLKHSSTSLCFQVFRQGRCLVVSERKFKRRYEVTFWHTSAFPEPNVRLEGGKLRIGSPTKDALWACTDATDREIALCLQVMYADVLKHLKQPCR